MGKSRVEHHNHDINIQKNHTYETLLFLLSILSQLALDNKSYGNICELWEIVVFYVILWRKIKNCVHEAPELIGSCHSFYKTCLLFSSFPPQMTFVVKTGLHSVDHFLLSSAPLL